jgi:hypothetical protein
MRVQNLPREFPVWTSAKIRGPLTGRKSIFLDLLGSRVFSKDWKSNPLPIFLLYLSTHPNLTTLLASPTWRFEKSSTRVRRRAVKTSADMAHLERRGTACLLRKLREAEIPIILGGTLKAFFAGTRQVPSLRYTSSLLRPRETFPASPFILDPPYGHIFKCRKRTSK